MLRTSADAEARPATFVLTASMRTTHTLSVSETNIFQFVSLYVVEHGAVAYGPLQFISPKLKLVRFDIRVDHAFVRSSELTGNNMQ